MRGETAMLWSLFAVALLLGAMFVLPIGGGDMPVVISILNSLTGLAAALTGFGLHNQMLVVAGGAIGAVATPLPPLTGTRINRAGGDRIFRVVQGAGKDAGRSATPVW